MVLSYLVESQVILADVASELTAQGVLVAELAQKYPNVWNDYNAAQTFCAELSPKLNTRLMLLNTDGVLLGSNNPSDADRLGQKLDIKGLDSTMSGQVHVNLDYSTHLHTEVVDVLIPVIGSGQSLVGIIRLSRRLLDIYRRFTRLRIIIAGVLTGGLLMTVLLGVGLSLNIERPLRQLTETVQKLISGVEGGLLIEKGPDEIRVLQRAFNQLITRLNDLDQTRRRLITNLVHELGRSLGALRAAILALLHGGSEDPILEHDLVAGMDEETKQLRRLLDDLANLQDVLSGSLEMELEPLAVSEWLPVAIRPWETMALAKGLHWSQNIPSGLPLIKADTARLDQALGNLLSNAIKFTPKDGRVTISADSDGQFFSIHVRDNGPGIPPEEQERVFMPFYQSHSGSYPATPGMGLGLSIARELIVRLDGEILVESRPGQGTRFTIRLPISPGDHKISEK